MKHKEKTPVLMESRVLVVGTTSDYIQWIKSLLCGEVFFITDLKIRQNAFETPPEQIEEVVCDLSDYKSTVLCVKKHVEKYSIHITGIACFDCESMEITAIIAKELGLKFESLSAIHNCRDKFISKSLWSQNNLHTPKATRVQNFQQATCFFENLESQKCVLKPSSGAGSELVFLCHNLEELELAYKEALERLKGKNKNRLYNSPSINSSLILEEYISGTEYSCDFIFNNSGIKIIRLTEKLKCHGQFFGIIDGYKLINYVPSITEKNLKNTLYKAAQSLGLKDSICMVDFIVRDKKVFLIEIAPRPGGDCLPQLLETATGQNILAINIELAQGKAPQLLDYKIMQSWTALRIFANKRGTLLGIDTGKLLENPTVAKVNITAFKGRKIELPPIDYDSWVLGNIIIKFDIAHEIYEMAPKILSLVSIQIK